jgi:Protein of unknown function (DUF1761)
MHGIHVWATLAAAASSFLLGGLWYSPLLFLKPWAKAAGFSDLEALEKSHQGKHPAGVFVISGAFSVIAAFVFAWCLGPSPTLSHALGFGLAVGLGLVATSFGINYQFGSRPMALWLIDGGYHTLQFLLFGLILGLWHA